jgi:hypothetical protein
MRQGVVGRAGASWDGFPPGTLLFDVLLGGHDGRKERRCGLSVAVYIRDGLDASETLSTDRTGLVGAS